MDSLEITPTAPDRKSRVSLDFEQIGELNKLIVDRPMNKIGWSMTILVLVIVLNIMIMFRGTPFFDSIDNLKLCSLNYWIIWFVYLIF